MAEIVTRRPGVARQTFSRPTDPASEGRDAVPSGPGEAAGAEAGVAPITDVWSRTSRKYRVRAVVFLLLTLLLFIALCAFTHWLHVARFFDFSLDSYLQPLQVWGTRTQNLNDFLRFPISVEQTPIHGVVLGLLVASIVAVPILVSILYRFPCALPFIAAVALFGHLPWMSLTLLGGCILASLRPFRFSFRYGSALLGLLPVLLYLYLATSSGGERPDNPAAPTERWVMLFPWVLAVLAACLMMGTVLLIARIVNYRPGAIAPIMAVTFATPAVLFFRHVGADELGYRILEHDFGPRAARFAPVSDLLKDFQQLFGQVAENPDALADAPIRELWSGRPEMLHDRLFTWQQRLFLADRSSAYEACRAFIADHPQSRYVANVLYVQARVLDLRIDERAFREDARRELYSDFPHPQSEGAWTALANDAPRSALAMAARVRLAQLRLRQGSCEAALAVLKPLSEPKLAPLGGSSPVRDNLFAPSAPEDSLDFDPRPFVFEVQRLRELIERNADDPRHGPAPLQALAGLDPRRPAYRDELLRMLELYPGCLLEDNILVRWAAVHPDTGGRYRSLAACVDRWQDGDALPEALYELANLEILKLAENDPLKRTQGIERMRDIAERFVDTCWGRAAMTRLKMLEPHVAGVLEKPEAAR